MKDYNYNENREEQSAREIGKKFAELGFGTVMTDEEYARSQKRIEKSEKRYKFFGSVFSELRTIRVCEEISVKAALLETVSKFV